MPRGGSVGSLAAIAIALHQGRDPAQIEITTAAPGPDLDAIRRLEDQGVARLVMSPPGFDRNAVRAGLEKFADAVLTRL